MAKSWGAPGAWALDAERAEEEEREVLAGQPAQSFPSLKEATASKPKKKRGVTVSLSEFVTPTTGRGIETRGLTNDEMLRLPTGPKERSAEELDYRGRGFRSYGTGPRGDDGGRRSQGSFDDDSRRGAPPRGSDMDQPSRADEVDNWAAGKRSFAPMDTVRSDRYSGGGGGGSSRADDLDSWTAGKKTLPSRNSSFGTGFRDSSSTSDSDRWGGGARPVAGERPRFVLDPPKRDARAPSQPARTRPSPFGAARPREEVLKEKGLDPRKIDSDIEAKKTSRPTSSQSSRPSSGQSSRAGSPGMQRGTLVVEEAPRPQVKVNPFGNAKPREVRLEEKGIDWRKLDLDMENRRVGRPETEEEKLLKEEINRLKTLLKETKGDSNTVGTEYAKFSAEDPACLTEQILHKETELEVLMRQLDDKMRFSQRSSRDNRPGSGSGRLGVSSDRPPSQSGRSEESRSEGEFMDRPRSRGSMGDGWGRPMDDRRGFQGGSRERGFLSDRNMDRSKARAGW